MLLAGWSVAIAIGASVIYGIQATTSGPRTPQWLAVLYQSVSRFAFAIALSWVIMICVTGNGGKEAKQGGLDSNLLSRNNYKDVWLLGATGGQVKLLL